MRAFIKLTQKVSGKPLWINPTMIQTITQDEPTGAFVGMSGDETGIPVRESVVLICKKLGGLLPSE